MSLLAIIGDSSQSYPQKLSKTESKIMETLMMAKSGNAYGLWKASKLKHYPTVLRTLRKLREKNLVEILSKDGVRRETTYTPTIQGSFVFYILRNEEKELFDFLMENSRLFKEFHEVQRDKTWVYSIVRESFWAGRRRKINFDELLRESVELSVLDCLSNICYDQKARKELREFWKVSWIRPIIIESIEREIDLDKRHLKVLTELKEEFNVEQSMKVLPLRGQKNRSSEH
jgi:DNA-binding PadR family transcriptional regulator